MRILLIHQYFLEKGDGGGSRFNEMARMWVELGHEVTVISGMVHYTTGKKYDCYKGKYIVNEMADDGVMVYRCHVSEAYNKNFIGRLWAYFSFVVSSLLCGVILKKKYDVLLVTSPPLFVAITGILLSKFKHIPFVFEVRDLWPESAIDTGVLNNRYLITAAYWLEKQAYRNAQLVNTLTPAFQEKIVSSKGVADSKVTMIPNAADFSISDEIVARVNRKQIRESLGLAEKFIVTYVGAHGIANHLKQILEAAELLKGSSVCFLLIGDGMQKEWLKAEAKRKNLENVRFIDPVSKEKVFEYIFASDIGISVLKKVETFKTVYSNKTFDYMACKKPVLMAIDGVSRTLVEKAECGVYVEPENPSDLAQKTLRYFEDKELAQKHGLNGYHFAKKHFDRKILALEYLERLSEIARSNRFKN